MKRFFVALLIMLLPLNACAEDNLVYWINPDGGRYYHLDLNCPVENPKFLPLQVSMIKEELEQSENSFYLPCNICVDESHVVSVPEEIKETGMPTEEPAWEMIIDPKYSEYTLKDRYVEERPVWIDEHNMLAKAGWNPEGVFLSLPDGDVGLAAISANTLNFYRWGEDGLITEKSIEGKWQDVRGNTKGVCATRKTDENTAFAHLFDPAGNEIWTYEFNDPGRISGWYANPDATDGAGTYLVIVRVESDLRTAFCVRNREIIWQQNLLYGGNAFYAGDQTFIVAETTSDDDLYADIILDHRDMEGKSLGIKRLSGDGVVKSIHVILQNAETGGYTIYGRAVANSRQVYTVFRMELDSQMNQQSISVRDVDFYPDYNFSVITAPDGDAYVYCRTYDETYVQPVLVPFNVLEETESHGIRLH